MVYDIQMLRVLAPVNVHNFFSSHLYMDVLGVITRGNWPCFGARYIYIQKPEFTSYTITYNDFTCAPCADSTSKFILKEGDCKHFSIEFTAHLYLPSPLHINCSSYYLHACEYFS